MSIVVVACRKQILRVIAVCKLQTYVGTCAVHDPNSICQEPVLPAADSTQNLHDIEHVLGLMVGRADAANHDANNVCHKLSKVLQRCSLRIEFNRVVGLKHSLDSQVDLFKAGR